MFFTRSPLKGESGFKLEIRDNEFESNNKKQRRNELRDLRGGNLEVWNGPVVNSQTTFLPKR